MKTNFIETIKKKTPLLVESYVSQYGEEYRNTILKRIESTKFVFFINPNKKEEILTQMRIVLEKIATFDFLKRLGLSEEELETNNDKDLEFKNHNVSCLLHSFFSNILLNSKSEYIEKNSGIYSFLNDGKNNQEHFQILKERMNVLKKLGLVDIKEKDYHDFEHSELYQHATRVYSRVAQIALEYAKMIEYKCSNVKEICNDIECKNLTLKKDCVRSMIKELKNLLPFQDKEIIRENPNFNPEDLPQAELLFDIESLDNNSTSFGKGLLEILYEDDKKAEENVTIENPIIRRKLEYLKRQDINIGKKLSVAEAKKVIDEYQHLFPTLKTMGKIKRSKTGKNKYYVEKKTTEEIIKTIKQIRNKYETEYIMGASEDMIIEQNVSSIDEDYRTQMINNVVARGWCGADYNDDKTDLERKVFIEPLTSYIPSSKKVQLEGFNYVAHDLDRMIDHEIRHAIEYHTKGENILIIGFDVYEQHNDEWSSLFLTKLDEAYTEKLTIESCEKRWSEGNFIFSPKIVSEEIFGKDCISCSYEPWFPNLDIIIDGKEQEFAQAKIEDLHNKLDKMLPYEDWKKISELISQPTEEAREELKGYALKIKRKR